MKVIDLLNKIANGEEVPMFKYEGRRYEYSKATEMLDDLDSDDYCKSEIYFCELNDEVEILEEEPRDIEVCGSLFTKSEYDKLAHCEEEKKIPEKLTDILRIDDLIPPVDENMYKIWTQTIKNHNKINEICDYLKSKGE